MDTTPKRTRTARARFQAKRSPEARNRFLLVALCLLFVLGFIFLVTGTRIGGPDLPTWEGHAETARHLNEQLARLADRPPAGPNAPEADAWLDEVQKILDQFVEIALTGAVGDRAGYLELKQECARTRAHLKRAMPGDAWAEVREAALDHVPSWQLSR